MAQTKTKRERINPLQSLFFKTTFIVALCVIVVAATVATMNHLARSAQLQAQLSTRAEEVTRLLAMQMGGSIKFGNVAAVDQIVSGVMEAAGREALGALVARRDGEAMFVTPGAALDLSQAEKLAQQALETGSVAVSESGLSVALPVTFGGDSSVVGSVVTGWTDEYCMAAFHAETLKTSLAALAVLVAALVATGYFLLVQMTRPMLRLRNAMTKIAEGDYDIDIKHTDRRDEIGQMAQRLDEFRGSLAEASAVAVESAFRGAAFLGSSAAMMMVDETGKVIFVNPACTAMIEGLHPALSRLWPGVTGAEVIGADLSEFSGLEEALSDLSDSGVEITARIGERIVGITVNQARDAEGARIGAVVEWTDRTQAQRNAVLIETIDSNQIRVESTAQGEIHEANDLACGVSSGLGDCLAGQRIEEIFGDNLVDNQPIAAVLSRVREGTPVHGRFEMFPDHATARIIEGSFTPVIGLDRAVQSILFLGADVTEADACMRAAEAERTRVAVEQKEVVEALGVALTDLAGGDLNSDIASEFPPAYEKLRDDFNAAVTALRDAMSAVMQNAESIRNETTEITSAADDLSRRTEKQAATLEETAAALDELTASVRSAAAGADDASTMSAEAQKNAEQGGAVARRAVEAMDGIKTSSQEISKITSVIDDIAFQTNLLALNAGVEAARAGEAGRGFAVVATEVRALAQRSSDAAREINALISSSGDQVQQGVDLVDRTGAALAAIVTSVSEISDRVSAIADSAREQSSGLAEINSAVTELDHVTQQNAAMFEETTAASHALTGEADALAHAVARFRIAEAERPALEVAPMPLPAARSRPAAAAISLGNAALARAAQTENDGWEEF